MKSTKEQFYDVVEQAKSCSALYRHRKARHKLVLAAPVHSDDNPNQWIVLYQGRVDYQDRDTFMATYEFVQPRPLYDHSTIDTQAR